MLVKCPECQNEISKEADPCPSCGFPKAGKKSLQTAEENAKYFMRQETTGMVELQCEKCRHINRPISVGVEEYKGRAGFYCLAEYKCKKCGHRYTSDVGWRDY
jgi:predicted nucleic-acid-binding Zn-ribbon protein